MGRAARLNAQRGTRSVARAAYDKGLDALRGGNAAAAIVLFRQAIIERPDDAPSHFRLAMTLRGQGDLSTAIRHYETALSLDPRNVDAHVNYAEALRRAGRKPEARDACDRAIAIDCRHGEAYLIRGVVRHDLGDSAGAIADLDAAISANPKLPDAQRLLGKICLGAGQKEKALAAFRQATLGGSGDAETFRHVGDVCNALGHLGEGFVAYRKAIELDPKDVATYANLTGLLCKTKLLDIALSVADVGLKLAPDFLDLHFNRAVALEKLDRIDEALGSYARALRLDPGSGRALIAICRLKAQICDWDGLDEMEPLARRLTFQSATPTPPFSILLMSSSLPEILDCNRVWSNALDPTPVPVTPTGSAPRPHQRLRIGYLSADFHTHATAALVAELFELHDKTRFETWGYSIGAHDEGPMRQRLVEALDHFHDLTDVSHAEAAARIRADAIDILIDLKGYTFQARTEILVHRPAPIQVSFLGYPATMGARFIDYIIGDPIVTPMAHAPFYAERIAQLPDTYQPNDRRRVIASYEPSRRDFGLPDDGFVFCCFNSNQKITSSIFDVWMRLLRDVPTSVLWLLQTNAAVSDNLRREAVARGVDPSRIVFAPKLTTADHLARLRVGDLFLDTSPYGAHTTASEALWAELPVLTHLGEAFASRVGASLLRAVGLPELIATSLADYEATARRLAEQPEIFQALRDRLRQNRLTAPLFDSPRYARHFDRALLQMAAIRNAGETPRAFRVEASD